MRIVIVIPVYKNPTIDELVSLRRCCHVLSEYDMCVVCQEGFDASSYQLIWNENNLNIRIMRFDSHFFKNISSYNSLLLSDIFYGRFAEYDYMLICQPDAYVFEDNLQYWCAKGYDYVGAPLIGKYEDVDFYPNIMRVGNGGFSLRRIQAYLDYFNSNKNVIPINKIAARINLKEKVYSRWFVWLLMAFGWRNKPKSFANHWKYNEDDFWSGALTNTNYELTKPTPREAMNFAFERFPKELFQITGKLPLGCHAWRKYQYESFWKEYIR